MRGIIVLDGPDGSGKTTLAQHFVEKYGARYLHASYRFKQRMFDYHTALIHRAGKLARDHLVIVDRWWMSEICYGNAYRNGTKWPLYWRMMQRVLLKYSGVYVYCLPADSRKHLETFDDLKSSRPEMFKDQLPVVIEYHKLWDKVREWPNVIRYDRFSSDGENLEFYGKRVLKLMTQLQGDQPAQVADPNNYNVTGHVGLAKWLMVGEQTNQKKRQGSWWPFHDYGASSLYLTKMIDDLGIQEHDLVWCNALGTPEMARWLLDRFELKPVCFGGESYLWVTEKRADMYSRRNQPLAVLHPAYDMRFPEHRKGAELRSQLGNVFHGHGTASSIYRDNVCIACKTEILDEDKRDSIANRMGIILPRGREL